MKKHSDASMQRLMDHANYMAIMEERSPTQEWLHDVCASFIRRVIHAGIEDIDSLLEIIPDSALRQELRGAASSNPTRSSEQTSDTLAREILMLESSPANED